MESSRIDDGLSPQSGVLFVALQRRFVAGLAARWTVIRDAPDEASLRAALHRLRGSAGSYGFAALGRCAGEVEAVAGRGPGPDMAQKLALLEEEIRRIEARWAQPRESGPA